ncbi:hypothetical protein CLUG_04576 [Clavispora lusitaniae ATCC 42720]|uniref:Uncharacterized protein n=1 Tax=Clavispora lusitaniae (strain ATCC 42720) TaxID=306902 RepID=C4Y8P8_CLAL4|nr:uncharacterized protein CLUG_04576 [Clavispora lusitaniae ATCC 42720]EEQ40447.1 hypothetical protein CLUG_04576 [Clavispora lusitaniae ATCC 42720]
MTQDFWVQDTNGTDVSSFTIFRSSEKNLSTSTWEESSVVLIFLNPVTSSLIFCRFFYPWRTHSLHDLAQQTLNKFKTRSLSRINSGPVSSIKSASFELSVLQHNITTFEHLNGQRMLSVLFNSLENTWQQCSSDNLVFDGLGVFQFHSCLVIISSSQKLEVLIVRTQC